MPKRHIKPWSEKGVKAAELVAMGMDTADVAAELGCSPRAVNYYVTRILNYRVFADQRNARLVANARLNRIAERLVAIAGLERNLRPDAAQVPALRALLDLEKQRAELFGYVAPTTVITREANPFDSMSPAELFDECLKRGVEPPAGLGDYVRSLSGDTAAPGGEGGIPPATEHRADLELPTEPGATAVPPEPSCGAVSVPGERVG